VPNLNLLSGPAPLASHIPRNLENLLMNPSSNSSPARPTRLSGRRRLLGAGLVLAAAPIGAARAQSAFPNRPIRIVIPYGTGGGTDILIRALAPSLSRALGQNIVVENKPGGGSVPGTETVVRSPADGYTLLAMDSAILTNPGLRKLPYDTVRDLTGLSMVASGPVLLVVHPSVPARDLKELLALARSRPGALNYASGGNGTSTHLAAELMKLAAGVDITHIPYKGTGPAMVDQLAGHVQMQFAGISTARPHVEGGKLRAIAVTGSVRSPALPGVPTFIEQGLEGVDASTYWGVYAPAGTPEPILHQVSEAIARVLKEPEVLERLVQAGFVPIGNRPAEHTRMMRSMIDSWSSLTAKAGIRLD
jgi:tripartite-type tricarboxylate transporter receptor subunit TctC